MCGRFTNTANPNSIQIRFDIEAEDLELVPRYNIAPTQEVPIVVEEEGQRKLVMMRWGLIPGWAKEASIGNRMINARLETLPQKPAFKRYFQKSRCIVPADSFHEWKKSGKEKQPLRIVLKSRQLFGMAGLWTKWRDAEGKEIKSCGFASSLLPILSGSQAHAHQSSECRLRKSELCTDFLRWIRRSELMCP